MALKLKRVQGPVWKGKTGESFQVEVVPQGAGGPFLIHSICYGSTCLTDPPFEFTILAGDKGLAAVYDWDQEGVFVELREVATGATQVLRKRQYQEKEPFQSILIKGGNS